MIGNQRMTGCGVAEVEYIGVVDTTVHSGMLYNNNCFLLAIMILKID
jgi:hypothetical protein